MHMHIYIHIYIYIFIYIYICIHVYRCTPVHTEPSIHACMYIHAYVHSRGDGYRRTQTETPMRVCVHPGIRTCLDAQASIQTHSVQMGTPQPSARTCAHAHKAAAMRTLLWKLRAHSCTHMHICTQMHARNDTRLVGARVCRSRRALTRTYEHAHTLAWNLHVHPYARTCTHT